MVLRRFSLGLIVCSLCSLPGQAALDLNNNGMSDIWEQRFGVLPNQAALDPDGDGLSNFQESQLGTDPFRADSKLGLVLSRPADKTNGLLLVLSTAFGKCYQLEASNDLVRWSAIGSLIFSQGLTCEVRLGEPSVSAQFYRCKFLGDLDADGDGLAAWEEAQLGSRDDDADNNGLSDDWELRHFGCTQIDPEADPDGDGVPNLAEFQANTEPLPSVPVICLELPVEALPLP